MSIIKYTVKEFFGDGFICRKCGHDFQDPSRILGEDIRPMHVAAHERGERGHIKMDAVRNFSGEGFLFELWQAIWAYGETRERRGYGDGGYEEMIEAEDRVLELLKQMELGQ